ncbi:MAG: carbohydrate-binding family 9-like protein [Candidatus Omnitrophica bacterium]|nr:carbohydrate-binding family 9-like protein [Candidatus Omnitrophota bacterium]
MKKLAGIFLSLACLVIAAEEINLSPGEMKTFSLLSPKSNKVYLGLTGRYQADGEGEWLQYHVSLRLNGRLLTHKEIVGSKEIIYPRYGVLTAKGPQPRYDPQKRVFAFKLDNDFQVNNPPYLWDNPVPATTEGYSHTLTLDVTALVKAGENRLIVYNSNSFQKPRHGITGVFVMLPPILADRPPTPVADMFPVYAPVWYYYQKYPKSLNSYRSALKKSIDPVLKAEIAGSIGIHYLFSRQKSLAEKYFWASLDFSGNSSISDEVRFRLMRLAFARKKIEQARNLVVNLAPSASSFAGLALAYFSAVTGQENSIRPRVTAKLLNEEICVDGLLDEPVWEKISPYSINQVVAGIKVKTTGSTFRVFYNDQGLAFGFSGPRPPISFRPASRQPKLNSPVWETNCFELFVDPGCLADYYYELNIDDSGGIYHGKNRYLIGALAHYKPAWQAAAFSTNQQFTAEYLIPWSDFSLSHRPSFGEVWGINVIRVVVSLGENGKEEEDYSFSPLQARNFHRIMDQGLLIFQ